MVMSKGIYTPRYLGSAHTDSKLPRLLRQRRIDTPAVVILLGSTPAYAAMEMERHLETHIEKDRRRVSFVYIDTDDLPVSVKEYQRGHQGWFQEFTLRISVPAGVQRADMPPHWQHTFVPNKIPVSFANGAGGIRNNGHVAAAFNANRLRSVIEDGIKSVETLGLTDDEERINEMQVNIVAFLGGGTGSGILPDVAMIARSMLLDRGYKHRLNLFCILPEPVVGFTPVDFSWRKSNATATLLEILGISLAAAANAQQGTSTDLSKPLGAEANMKDRLRGRKVYKRYLLHDAYDVSDQNYLANEIYLIGSTRVGTSEGAARVVGLDLYERIADASGVGALEHSKWVDRRSLGKFDDRKLPTPFGTTCPLDARMPVQETAHAFAQISAAMLLPHLVPTSKTFEQDPTGEQLYLWEQHWARAGAIQSNVDPDTEADRYAVQELRAYSFQDFVDLNKTALDLKFAEYKRALNDIDERLKYQLKEFEKQEYWRIAHTPEPEEGDNTPIIGRRMRHLQQLIQEYSHILSMQKSEEGQNEQQREYSDNEINERIKWLADGVNWPSWLPLPFPVPPFIEKSGLKNHARALEQALNYNLGLHPVRKRRELLIEMLEKLLKQAQEALNSEEEWLREGFLAEQVENLRRQGKSSPAWRGKLDHEHPHQFHIFDHSLLRDEHSQQNLGVQRLYFQLTMAASLQAREIPPGDDTLDDFPPTTLQNFLDSCGAYLASESRKDYAQVRNQTMSADDLEEFGKRQLATRVVNFFERYYHDHFVHMTLFDFLRIGLGTARNDAVSEILFAHLNRMKRLLGELIVQEETLYSGGAESLDQSLYFGIYCEENTADDAIVNDALKRLGAMTNRALTPMRAPLLDPHRMQMVYGVHGISISTIPDFYHEDASMMSEYLRHQGNWMNVPDMATLQYADWSSYPHWPGYGTNDMPPHGCGELERIVDDPNALGYHGPCSSYGPSLVGRVIRDVQRPGGDSGNGYHARQQGVGPSMAGPGGGHSGAPPQSSPWNRSQNPQWDK